MHEQATRGIEHGDVDPLAVHGRQLSASIEAPRDVVGEPGESALEAHARDLSRQRERIGAVHRHADVHRGPRRAARRPVAKGGIDVALPEIRGLQHVHVAVEDFVAVFHESLYSPPASPAAGDSTLEGSILRAPTGSALMLALGPAFA